MHASTFSGNALSMAAGLAAMQDFCQEDISRINVLGERLRQGFNNAFLRAGIRAQATGQGSLTNIHFSDGGINNGRDAIAGIIQAGHISRLLHLTMLRNGVLSATRLMYCISTAMTDTHIDQAILVLEKSLAELLPYIKSERPNLLKT